MSRRSSLLWKDDESVLPLHTGSLGDLRRTASTTKLNDAVATPSPLQQRRASLADLVAQAEQEEAEQAMRRSSSAMLPKMRRRESSIIDLAAVRICDLSSLLHWF
eukprot:Colp12_sorted_trinity150504_noHs@5806